MVDNRRRELEEKLNMAEASGDAAAIAAVKKTMEREYRECTAHTAERLKRVEATVYNIKDGLIPAGMFEEMKDGMKELSKSVNALKTEMEAWKNKAKGAKILWSVLATITAVGGGGMIMKLLELTAKTSGH